MGTPISGKNGKVTVASTDIGDVTKWSLDLESNNPAYASNSTSGVKKRVAGVKDSSGSIEYKLDSAAALPLAAGDTVTLKLYINASKYYQGDVIIDKVGVVTDIDTGEIVAQTAQFSGNGAWTPPSLP